jgi:hypothetical protein
MISIEGNKYTVLSYDYAALDIFIEPSEQPCFDHLFILYEDYKNRDKEIVFQICNN